MSNSKKQIFLIFSKMLGVGHLFEGGDWCYFDRLHSYECDYSKHKELLNFYLFLENVDDGDLSYEPISRTNRKDCMYSSMDRFFFEFCVEKSIDTRLFIDFLKALCLFSMVVSVLLQQYEIFYKNKLSLESLINGDLWHFKKLILWTGIMTDDRFFDLKSQDYDFLKFLKICIFIRYSFNNSKFRFSFDKKGWDIEIDLAKLTFIKRLYYINRDVNFYPEKILFSGVYKNIDFMSNSNFSKAIWIEKFNHLGIETNLENNGFLEKSCEDCVVVLNGLNYLNSTIISINTEILDFVFDLCVNTEFYKISPNYLMTWLALKDLKFFLKFNNFLFLSYIIDRRARIYCKNIPINPQLDKILRLFLLPVEKDDFLKINTNFIKDNLYRFKIDETYNSLKHVKILSKLWDKKIQRSGIRGIEDLNINLINVGNIDFYIEKILFLQQLMDVSVRYGDFNTNIEETIKEGCERLFLGEITYSEDDIEGYIQKKIIINWINSDKKWLEINWFNDASASVFQLLVIKLLNCDEFTLKVSNIVNNDTDYKDIYKYIEKMVCERNENFRKWISRSLIKKIIMPGIYGQKIPKMINECEIILKKNKDWLDIKHETRKEIILSINRECWEILKEMDVDVLKYLELSRKLAKKSKVYYWNSMLGTPIVISKSVEIDRKKLLKKLLKSGKNLSEKSAFKIKDKLNNDEKNYCRKNIRLEKNTFKKNYIKIRLKNKSKEMDLNALLNSLCPSSIHSEDASILMKIIEECSTIGIGIIPIHDSVGTKIYFSSMLKTIYKKKFIDYIEYILSDKEFPINLIIKDSIDENFKIERKIKKEKFIKLKEKIMNGVRKSNNIFN